MAGPPNEALQELLSSAPETDVVFIVDDEPAIVHGLKPCRDIAQFYDRVVAAVAKNRAVKQHRLLIEWVKNAYEELYTSKAEIEMLHQGGSTS